MSADSRHYFPQSKVIVPYYWTVNIVVRTCRSWVRNLRHYAESVLAHRRWRWGHSSLVALAGQRQVQWAQLASLVWCQHSLPTLGHHRRPLCVSMPCVNHTFRIIKFDISAHDETWLDRMFSVAMILSIRDCNRKSHGSLDVFQSQVQVHQVHLFES